MRRELPLGLPAGRRGRLIARGFTADFPRFTAPLRAHHTETTDLQQPTRTGPTPSRSVRHPPRLSLLAILVTAAIAPALNARAATPSTGEPQQPRTGLFLDVGLGVTSTLGGQRLTDGAFMPSTPSAYLQIGVGYDVLDRLALGLTFGLGATRGRCLGAVTDQGACVESASDRTSMASDFTQAFVGAEISYRQPLGHHLRLSPRLHLGWTFLDPAPRDGLNGGFGVGIALGLEWATPLDHFTLGVDIDWRLVVGPNLNTLGLFPRVKYTF